MRMSIVARMQDDFFHFCIIPDFPIPGNTMGSELLQYLDAFLCVGMGGEE